MSENEQDESNSKQYSYRSPTFTKIEVQTLISLVEKFKHIILNKCTNSSTNHEKDVAWAKIAKLYNEEGFKHNRSADRLKIKWDNLKKEARKLSKNVIDVDCNDYHLRRVLLMMNESPKCDNNAEVLEIAPDSSDVKLKDLKDATEKYWDEDNKMSDNSEDGDSDNLRLSRSLNFSPQECSLLLKCVRSEKKHIFSKENSGKAVKFKNNAWSRITHSFNKLSARKRSTKTLRTKFRNMKQLAKNVSISKHEFGHSKLEESMKEIKSEPSFECTADMENDSIASDNESINHDNKQDIEMPDPLSTVFNGDSGIDSSSCFGFWNQSQEKEVAKRKLELLNYQLETAKLERKRVQQAMEAEKMEHESRAIENSLRLRTARIALAAAESQLPSGHSALNYQANEIKVKLYLES